MKRKLISTIQDNIAAAYEEGKTPAFAYDRVSTQEQADSGYSLDHQSELANEYAKNNKLHIVNFYSATESAYKEGRKEFNQMIDDALAYDVKDIIFKNTDRLGRNDIDWPRCKKLARDGKINIHLYELNTTFHTKSTAEDEMFLDNTSVMAKYWSNKISQGVKKSYEYKVSKGVPPSRPPIGYLYDKDNKIYIIDPDKEEIIHFIFNDYDNSNISIKNLAVKLNDNGYRTANGKKWHTSKVHYILTNPIYAGFFEYKGKEYQAKHETYISRDDFYERLEKLNKKYNGASRRQSDFIFAKFLRHEDSKRLLSGIEKKNKYIYYCRNNVVFHKEEYIIDEIGKELNRIQFTQNYAEILKQTFKTVVNEKLADSAVIQKQITENINTLEVKRSKIIDLYTDEDINKDDLKQKLHEIRNEISRLRKKQNQVDFNKDSFTLDIAQAIDDIKNVAFWYDEATNEKKAEIIKSMAKYIDVFSDHIVIHWKNNYSLILKEGIYSNALNTEKVPNCTVMGG